MRSRLAALGITLLSMTANQARADWQYTSWGMPLTELLAVSDAVEVPDADSAETPTGHVRATAPYSASGLKGTVAFAFKDDGLSGVLFFFIGKNRQEVLTVLQDQYGAPIDTRESLAEEMWLWRDEENGNSVRYVHFAASFDPDILVYTPIHDSEESGL